MLGITKRYSADFIDMALSLMKHHYECIDTLYKDDGEVKELYKQYRSVSLTLDSMKLNYFHKDNPKPRVQRKEEFLKFADTEPFKSVINDFVIKKSDWWGWWLPMFYAKKRKFGMLEFAFRHEKAFQIYGGIISKLKKFD